MQRYFFQELIDKQTAFFEQSIIQSVRKNPNKYWSYVNNKLKSKRNFLNSIQIGDRTVEDPAEIAETLNEFFYNNFNKNCLNLHYS